MIMSISKDQDSMMERDIGHYCKVRLSSNSNVFLIVFSGANVKKGSFNYFNSFKNSEYNVIFLNDDISRYYQSGIQELGGDLYSTINALNTIIHETGCESPDIYTFGCSMGGYAALLYGALLNARSVLAFSPSAPKYCSVLWQNPSYKEVSSQSGQYIAVINDSTVAKKVYYGDRGIGDLCSFATFRAGSVNEMKIYKECCHALIYIIAQCTDLNSLVRNLVEGVVQPLFDIDGLIEYEEFEFLERIFLFGDAYFDKNKFDVLPNVNQYECQVSGVLAAQVEMLIPEYQNKAKELFFILIKKCLNARAIRLISPLLSVKEAEFLYREIITTKYNNPSLFGYDGGEKRAIGDSVLSLFDCFKRNCSDPKTFSSDFEGYFDRYDGEYVYGWAAGGYASKEVVKVKLNDTLIANAQCDQIRGDLALLCKGGDGSCAFQTPLEVSSLSSSTLNVIQAETVENKTLTYSNSYICNSFFIGSIDSIKGSTISGWVVNHAYRKPSIYLNVYVNRIFYKKVSIEEPRKDLLKKGYSLMSGFSVEIPNSMLSKESNFIDLYCYDDVLLFRNVSIN